MAEVPPHDPDPNDAPPPGEPPASPFRGIPRDPSVPLTPPPSPFGAPPQDEPPPAPAGAPPAFASGQPVPGPPASAGPEPPAPAPYASIAVTTTGVPRYGPPVRPPFAPVPDVAPPPELPPRPKWSVVRTGARGLRELAETVILALLIFLLVRSVVQNFQVEGSSMDPTFQDGWYLLVNKAMYWEVNLDTINKFVPFIDPGDDPTRYIFRGPKRGDVIVFNPPTQTGETSRRDFIKRVIALPGETIEIRDCTVFIDGDPLDEPYLTQPTTGTYGPFTVPSGEYFVMGDNRANSSDSRSWDEQPGVPKENIIGLAWLTYWPFDALGFVDNDAADPGDAVAAATDEKLLQACPGG